MTWKKIVSVLVRPMGRAKVKRAIWTLLQDDESGILWSWQLKYPRSPIERDRSSWLTGTHYSMTSGRFRRWRTNGPFSVWNTSHTSKIKLESDIIKSSWFCKSNFKTYSNATVADVREYVRAHSTSLNSKTYRFHKLAAFIRQEWWYDVFLFYVPIRRNKSMLYR